MKFIKPGAPSTPQGSEGSSGIPSWRRKWIENKVKAVQLSCGHTEDLHDNAITLINSFDGCQIDCIPCGKFVDVKGPVKRLKTTYPQTPMF